MADTIGERRTDRRTNGQTRDDNSSKSLRLRISRDPLKYFTGVKCCHESRSRQYLLIDYKAAKLQSCKAARLQGCKAIRRRYICLKRGIYPCAHRPPLRHGSLSHSSISSSHVSPFHPSMHAQWNAFILK